MKGKKCWKEVLAPVRKDLHKAACRSHDYNDDETKLNRLQYCHITARIKIRRANRGEAPCRPNLVRTDGVRCFMRKATTRRGKGQSEPAPMEGDAAFVTGWFNTVGSPQTEL